MQNIQHQMQWILQEKYHGKLTVAAKKDIERLKAGEPVDYIIGFMEFLDCKIDLRKRVLIPRPETEYWTEKAIEKIQDFSPKQNLRILDMFAGSGCIGIAILKHVKNSSVVFVDSKNESVDQIKLNLKINKIPSNRYKVIQSNAFEHVSGKFDYIFANPPYIPIVRKNKIQKSVLCYEPKEALFGGKDGLLYIRKLLTATKNFLNPGGKIYMEFDSIQKKKIKNLLKKLLHKTEQFHKDQYGKWRWVAIEC